MKLLIHHHAPAFQDAQGIHVQSFIGHWVNALSAHFETVGLLLPASATRSVQQDTVMTAKNIHIHPLPMGGKPLEYFHRRHAIRRICREVSPQYDALLIRGITPRQWLIWQNTSVNLKAFLLVGSLLENRPVWGWQPVQLLTWVLNHIRRREFGKIAQTGVLLANSPKIVQEIRLTCEKNAQFISTNTLSVRYVPPYVVKPINSLVQVLYCGRVVPDKGIEELIEAVGVLHTRRNFPCELVVVGPVSAGYQADLEQLSKQCGFHQPINWKGFIPFGESLMAQYQAADCMVLPSYHEGFPHSIWEAAVNSVPVVTTKVGGIPGLLDDSMVYFIEKKSPRDIADKILHLSADAETRRQKTAALYQFAQGFVVEAGAEQLAKVLSSYGATSADTKTTA